MDILHYDIAMISGSFAILGAVVGAIVGSSLAFCFGRKIVKDQAKRKAGQVLRQSFDSVHEAMNFGRQKRDYDSWSHSLRDALESALPEQEAAVKEYSFHLRGSRRSRFLEAWGKYHKFGEYERYPAQYLFEPSSWDNNLILFNERVEAILKFTQDWELKDILERLCHFCKKSSKSA